MRTGQTTISSSDRSGNVRAARAAQLLAGSPGRRCRPSPIQAGHRPHQVRCEPPVHRSPMPADVCIVNDDPSHVYLKRAHRQLDVLSHCRRALSTVPTSVHSYSDLCKPLPASQLRWSRLAIQQQRLTQMEPLLRVARRGEKRFTRPSSAGTTRRGAPPPPSSLSAPAPPPPRESMRIELISINIPCAIDLADTHMHYHPRITARPEPSLLPLLPPHLPGPSVTTNRLYMAFVLGPSTKPINPQNGTVDVRGRYDIASADISQAVVKLSPRLDAARVSTPDNSTQRCNATLPQPSHTVPGRTQVRAFTPSAGSRRCR
eukprot:COSAG03_NODE_1442_length_4075_cov_3.438129_1_plen_317_part_00